MLKAKEVAELRKDFDELKKHVDLEKYDPMSREFTSLLRVGLLCFLGTCSNGIKHTDSEEEHWSMEEIGDSKKYWQMYKATHDKGFLSMAKDELRHAGFIASKLKEHGIDTTELYEQIAHMDSMLKEEAR